MEQYQVFSHTDFVNESVPDRATMLFWAQCICWDNSDLVCMDKRTRSWKKERAASALCLKRIDAMQSLFRSSSLNIVCNPLPPNLSDAGIGETASDKFCNFSKLTIRQAWPPPLHNWLTTDQVCEGKKVCRVWTELLSWHNNFCHHLWVQLHECLWGETVQKCYAHLYN